MKLLDLNDEAKYEFEDAIRYYARANRAKADEFEQAVRDAFTTIARSPRRFAVDRGGPTRRLIMRKWPYIIYYPDLDDRVWIGAVAHNKRRPDYWAHRNPETP
ncbi:MAG: type II toxin-antitoxin system RelE/ParE family toxin [Gemmataceae bacterium]